MGVRSCLEQAQEERVMVLLTKAFWTVLGLPVLVGAASVVVIIVCTPDSWC